MGLDRKISLSIGFEKSIGQLIERDGDGNKMQSSQERKQGGINCEIPAISEEGGGGGGVGGFGDFATRKIKLLKIQSWRSAA